MKALKSKQKLTEFTLRQMGVRVINHALNDQNQFCGRAFPGGGGINPT